MRSFFNAENWLWKPLGIVGDLAILSLLWTVFSIPLFTLGPASAALYDAAVHSIRRREDTVITRFLATFKRELKQGILSTLVWAGAALALNLLLYAGAVYTALKDYWPFLAMLGLLLDFFLLAILCWAWPLLSRFTMDLGALHGTALRLAFGHVLRSVLLAALWCGTLWSGLRFIVPLFLLPALAALLSSFIIEPVFRLYEERK